MADLFPRDWPLKSPHGPEEPVAEIYDLDRFQYNLPPTKPKRSLYLTRPSHHDVDVSSTLSLPKPDSKFRTLFWPAVAITVPIALLSATLLALVFGYRVRSEPGIFQDETGNVNDERASYVLVNYSATRLVFTASFLSTLAPLLASFIMTLWGLIVSENMRMASTNLHFEQLPTPYQLSLLIGLCLASMEQLRSYLFYLASRKRRTSLPPVLNRAALLFVLSICLASAVFLADTALHYLTSTIIFDKITLIQQPTEEFGRGLISLCLDLDRVRDNYGFPCTMNVNDVFDDTNRTAKRNEMNRLQSNASAVSQVRLTNADGLTENIAIVIPQPETLAAGLDFHTSTVGVSTHCQLVPPKVCGMKTFGPDDTFTQFNCSKNYFGVLGKSPNITLSNGEKAIDPDVSPLAFKPAVNMDWAFFTSDNLSTLYNPESYDPTVNQPDNTSVIPDNLLLNPMYLGLATRVNENTFTVNSSILSDPDVFNNQFGYVEMVLSCAITSFSVNYTWYKSSIHNVTVEPTNNGTLLEMFHGTQEYSTVSGGGYDLQQYIVDAAIAGNNTQSFVNTWADLYSVKVLSLIGAYLTPRTNLLEQDRQALLVAKVPKPALGALVACSLIYTVLGVFLVVAAYKASASDVTVIAEKLSLAGLTDAAFGEGKVDNVGIATTTPGSGGLTSGSGEYIAGEDYFSSRTRRETRRVRISGTEFRVWV